MKEKGKRKRCRLARLARARSKHVPMLPCPASGHRALLYSQGVQPRDGEGRAEQPQIGCGWRFCVGDPELPSPRLSPEHLPRMPLVSLLRESWHHWYPMHKAVGFASGCSGQPVPSMPVALPLPGEGGLVRGRAGHVLSPHQWFSTECPSGAPGRL